MGNNIELSIIVPTLNRAFLLRRTLLSLMRQTCKDAGFEILILDNGSTDCTRDVAEEVLRSHGRSHVRYIFEPIPGLLSVRHRGIFEARGSILAFVDDDIEASPQWLEALRESFEEEEIHIVGGPSLPNFEKPPPDWLEAWWIHTPCGRYLGELSLLDFGVCPSEIDPIYVFGLNFAIRKKSVLEAGGFHPDCIPDHLQRYQGDGETGLCLKARKMGLKAVYNPKALVFHSVPAGRMTREYFERRAFYQGVCDSYTRIRSAGGFEEEKQNPLIPFADGLRQIPSRIKILLKTLFSPQFRTSNQTLRKKVLKSYRVGYEFHQREVRRDPELLNWVLKKDYWDYRLPSHGSA